MTNLNNNIKAILSLVVLIFGFAYFFYCGITAVKPDPSITIADVGFVGSVLGYWFGSSSGSSAKDATIADSFKSNLPEFTSINAK